MTALPFVVPQDAQRTNKNDVKRIQEDQGYDIQYYQWPVYKNTNPCHYGQVNGKFYQQNPKKYRKSPINIGYASIAPCMLHENLLTPVFSRSDPKEVNIVQMMTTPIAQGFVPVIRSPLFLQEYLDDRCESRSCYEYSY